jgi:two-component system, chemotaxis family, sensor kinase Cph1
MTELEKSRTATEPTTEDPQPDGPHEPLPLVHLPTWSRLQIATQQWSPAGNGGDFFELFQQRDGRVAAVIADVSGNGPSAATPVAGLRWVLRQALARGESPGAALSSLNDWLLRQTPHEERFVTAVCVRIDAVRGAAEMASAGHLGPFVKRANGRAEALPGSGGLALGILAGETYRETMVALEPEDAVVLVTDGITDRLSSLVDPLGQRGLLAWLADARPGADSVCRALSRAAARTTTDATVVVMQLPRRHRRATPVGKLG